MCDESLFRMAQAVIDAHLGEANVLSQVRVPVAGKDRTFAKGAIDQGIQANEDTDDISTLSPAWFREERHFTDEAFQPPRRT